MPTVAMHNVETHGDDNRKKKLAAEIGTNSKDVPDEDCRTVLRLKAGGGVKLFCRVNGGESVETSGLELVLHGKEEAEIFGDLLGRVTLTFNAIRPRLKSTDEEIS
jgi:hypothetical protein